MKRPSRSFWTTRSGIQITHTALTLSSFGVSVANFFPQTLLLKQYKDYMHLFSGNDQVPLPDELQTNFEKCMDILELNNISKKLQKSFTVFGFDVFHAGNAFTRQGAIIGIPINYSYKSVSDIDKKLVKINNQPVKWVSPAGEQLANCLIVPENQQTFSICREILSTQHYQVHLNTLYGFVALTSTGLLSKSINAKFRLFYRPSIVRYTLYSLISLFHLGMYYFAKDITQMSIEEVVDEKLCKLGPNFIQAGIEFYDNILKRNVALRELMGAQGESAYSTTGNDLFYFRQKTLPLTVRKKYFEEQLKIYEKNKLESDASIN